MQSDTYDTQNMPEIKNLIVKMAFKHQETVDYRTWAFLKKNKVIDIPAPLSDSKIYDILFDTGHPDRITTQTNGPLLCFRKNSRPTVAKVINLIFTDQSQWRKRVYNRFVKMPPGQEIGYNTLNKLKQIEKELISDNWIQAAIAFCDIVNADWLCNLKGLQQAIEINDEKGIQQFATNVFRPSIISAESIGIGVLQPSYEKNIYVQDFSQISEGASDLDALLETYYYKYAHIPLYYDHSLYSILDDFFEKHTFDNQQKWDSLWKWANNKTSPLPRYHICFYFVRNVNNVPESQFETLYHELLDIINMPIKESPELKWTSGWRLRCELAKHFGQFLESRLPGASSEKIYSQAWWMAERVASICGNESKDIAAVRKYTISSEEYMSNLVWQTSRPRTQSSSLRYATLMTSSLWAISIISQIDNRFLDYICKTNLQNKELFTKSVLSFLMGCFPLKSLGESNCIYAYDKTCINTAEYLSKNHNDPKIKEQFVAFICAIKRIVDSNQFMDILKSKGGWTVSSSCVIIQG